MNYMKRKATTKAKLSVHNLEGIKQQYLMNIEAVVEKAEIPDSLIINWTKLQ